MEGVILMNWTIPGTVLTAPRDDAGHIAEQFQAMFYGGGIVLSQVSAITGLESYIIQNWVKRGFLSPPEKKKYTLRQLCRIINIHMLKSALPMERICGLLAYINGQLDSEQDDTIDDSQLYFAFVRLAARVDHLIDDDPTQREQTLEDSLRSYAEPVPGAKERVKKVLQIMLTAWAAAQVRRAAENMVQELK